MGLECSSRISTGTSPYPLDVRQTVHGTGFVQKHIEPYIREKFDEAINTIEKLGGVVKRIAVDLETWQPILDVNNTSGRSIIEFKVDLAKHLAEFKS